MDWFAGATALVTGAANGIGRSTAEVLDELGARVIAVDIDGAALRAAFDGTHVTTFQGDVSTDGPSVITGANVRVEDSLSLHSWSVPESDR